MFWDGVRSGDVWHDVPCAPTFAIRHTKNSGIRTWRRTANNGASDMAESAPRAGVHDPQLPGLRELAAFAALFVLGLVVWPAGSPGITSRLFGLERPFWRPASTPFFFLLLVPTVCGALALVSGFVFPKGFYLWGNALNLHSPLADGLTVYMMEREGHRAFYGGTQGVVSYVVLTAALFVFTILCYTVLSTLGMCLRYSVGRLRRR